MAAPETSTHPPPPPLSPFDPTGQLFFSSHFPPVPPNPNPTSTTPAAPIPTTGPPTGQNHDRLLDRMPSPPPPPAPPVEAQPPPTVVPSSDPSVPESQAHHDSEGSEGHSESEEDDDDDEQLKQFQWMPLEEDKSEPCSDELAFIESKAKDEHSAVDEVYWHRKTFFELDDPELVPGDIGRIDWVAEQFNGTRENPNKEHIMRSPTVSIGGHDWRIKLYPRGNETDFISAYIECLTMENKEGPGTEDFGSLPLPFLEGAEQGKRRSAVSVQLSLVMYNPAEPSVYEYNRDAHQFTKSYADYGWTRFTRQPRRDFVFRHHGQRQAIYRDDKLAFRAYIRIVHDPTGCLWAHGDNQFGDSVALTSLRPFSPQLPMFAAELPLLHFAPFRSLIRQGQDTRIVFWLQTLLWKMMSRKHSVQYGVRAECVQSDTVAWLRFLARALRKEIGTAPVNELLGSLDPEDGAAIGSKRLKTKAHPSVQEAVDAHPDEMEKPVLLTLELERQEFDREERRWEKLTNKVDMPDKLTVSGTSYTLYAFATHCGDLESNKFNVFIRPNGKSWYKYAEGSVTCLTHQQAVGRHSGWDKPPKIGSQRRQSSHHHREHATRSAYRFLDPMEVAHVVMYVRDDYSQTLAAAPESEEWDVPQNVKDGIPPKFEGVENDEPPATAVYERSSEAEEAADVPVLDTAADVSIHDAAVDTPVPDADAASAAPAADAPTAGAPPADAEVPAIEPPPPAPEVAIIDEEPRQISFDVNAGYATPNCWLMDGEDVIMSDAGDEDSTTLLDTSVNEPPTTLVTIDVLGREYYQGYMRGVQYHGQGHLITMNGDEYIGTFARNLKSGTGKMIYATSGNIYEGSWEDGQRHGQGKFVEAQSGNVFEGGWRLDKKHGEFVLRGTVTEEDKGECSICYEREINTAFYDCGHVVACKECAMKIESCPVCRKRVLARLQLFGIKMTFE